MKGPGHLDEERASDCHQEGKIGFNHERIVGSSEGFQRALCLAEKVASTDMTVLISGEPGTGKELLAREIHRLSARSRSALFKVNCASSLRALTDSSLCSRGEGGSSCAWSWPFAMGEAMRGTTLFLDDIDALPLNLQCGLLNMMQENAGDFPQTGAPRNAGIRIIAAASHNLESKVRAGQFNEELWHHLNVFPISLPPLRNRRDDIAPLSDFFVKSMSVRMGMQEKIIPPMVLTALQAYDWPGNLRELKSVVEWSVMNSPGHDLGLPSDFKRKTAVDPKVETIGALG